MDVVELLVEFVVTFNVAIVSAALLPEMHLALWISDPRQDRWVDFSPTLQHSVCEQSLEILEYV